MVQLIEGVQKNSIESGPWEGIINVINFYVFSKYKYLKTISKKYISTKNRFCKKPILLVFFLVNPTNIIVFFFITSNQEIDGLLIFRY